MTTYIPKGGMCAVCTKNTNDCSVLDFKKMKPIKKKDSEGFVVVKCTAFSK